MIQSLAKRGEPFKALYNKFVYDRKRFDQDCSISYTDFVELAKIKFCHYCKEEVFWAEYSLGKNGYKYNLDRMNSNIGYHLYNVVVCCWSCNEMKSNKFTYNEFLEIGKILKSIKEKRNESGSK
jgi:hypothetical protein